MTLSVVVPRKGTTGAFAARRLLAFLREMGMGQSGIVVKSDGEAAARAGIDDVVGMRPTAMTTREEAPQGSSASNGVVERAVQSATHQLKVMKLWLESTGERRIPGDAPWSCG